MFAWETKTASTSPPTTAHHEKTPLRAAMKEIVSGVIQAAHSRDGLNASVEQVFVPTSAPAAKFQSAIEASWIASIAGGQLTSDVCGQRDWQAGRCLVESSSALHFPSKQQVGLVRVDDATGRLGEFRAEVDQMETVELTQAEVGEHKVERCLGQLPARGLEVDLVIDLRDASGSVQNVVSDIRVWLDQQDTRRHADCNICNKHRRCRIAKFRRSAERVRVGDGK
jgi:hypothetical protein